jgi:hypothetical protein
VALRVGALEDDAKLASAAADPSAQSSHLVQVSE